MDEMVQVIGENEARVNVTYDGVNADMRDAVSFASSDGDVKRWVTEALVTGSLPGMAAKPNADLNNFVVDRFAATEARPYQLIQVRPKTAFGA